jgi:hypothetical protein
VLLAVHGWAHGGLRSARDLLDVMVVAAENDRDELEDVARAWGVGRLWATTMAVGDWLVGESMREPAAVRIWARHLRTLRDATVAENHFERWISSFWMLPPRAAAGRAATEIIREFRREQRESWRRKLGRTARSIRHAHTSKTDYGWKR